MSRALLLGVCRFFCRVSDVGEEVERVRNVYLLYSSERTGELARKSRIKRKDGNQIHVSLGSPTPGC